MKNLTKLFVGMSLLGFALSSCSLQGPSGPQGEQGMPGENGKDGRDGIDGKDGTSVLTGNGEPSSTLGNDGDSYIDLDNWNYYVKEGGSWVNKGNIKGADGHDGQDGKDGEQGSKGEDGTDGQDGKDGVDGQDGKDGVDGADGQDGKDGADGRSIVSIEKTSSEGNVDTYTISYSDGPTSTFTVTNGEDGSQGIQGEKGADGHTPTITIDENGNWLVDGVDTGIKARGEKGDPGKDGENGSDGQDGKDGSSVLTGNGEPSSTLGNDGDSYIDLGTWNYYVKEGGSWVLKGNIKGADVDVVYHTVTFDVNGGNGSYEPQTIKHGEKVSKVSDPSRSGYQFLNWSYQDEAWSFVGYPVTEDMTLTAKWSPNLYALSVASEDETKGVASITSGSGYSDESITVAATPAEGCVFKGWYHDSTKVSKEATYSFAMPTQDYSLVAHFLTQEEEEAERAIQYGTKPILSGDGKTLTYGLYPQTNINDSALVSSLDGLTTPESNGWYLYDDVYYAKVSANPYDGKGTFDNGEAIVSGTTYWFKCEPITWNVLSSGEGYLVLSSVLLDAHCFHSSKAERTIGGETIYAKNYKYSDIRDWLNGDFSNSAFALGSSNIQMTTLEDGIQDKAFLLKTSDYTDSSYGFASKTDRNCKTTDWARARGAYCASDQYDGCYWTRTGTSSYNDMSYYVGYEVEEFLSGSVTGRYIATRPALTIQIA